MHVPLHWQKYGKRFLKIKKKNLKNSGQATETSDTNRWTQGLQCECILGAPDFILMASIRTIAFCEMVSSGI